MLSIMLVCFLPSTILSYTCCFLEQCPTKLNHYQYVSHVCTLCLFCHLATSFLFKKQLTLYQVYDYMGLKGETVKQNVEHAPFSLKYGTILLIISLTFFLFLKLLFTLFILHEHIVDYCMTGLLHEKTSLPYLILLYYNRH